MAKDSNKSKKRASTASTSSASLNGDPNTDKVTIYTSDTLNRGLLIERTEEILGKKPFDWQIDAAAAVLCGEDVVLDVGTGCGKSLCFSIPLVLNDTDVALRITPLTALMIDQAESSKLQSIALCTTLPDHVLDDIRGKLQLSKSVRMHAEESKADLRFLIPPDAAKPEDIPISLVYCNQRVKCEDAVDRLRQWAQDAEISDKCIAFYHAKVGSKQKRELERQLAKGLIRILVCTDAVGMGCDMRNISRVVCWELPVSFCALVQRIGRAGRDFTIEAEGILIVSKAVYESGVSEEEIGEGLDDLGSQEQTEAENHSQELPMNVPNAEGVVIDEMGERMEQGSEDEIGDEPKAKGKEPAKRRKKTNNVFNSHEAKALTSYMGTRGCRWKVWDNFFRNSEKLKFPYGDDLYRETWLSKAPGQLKRGRKQTFSERSATTIRTALVTWRDTVLIQHVYPNLVTIAGSAILGDDVIDKIVASGIKLDSAEVFSRHVRWAYGFDSITAKPNECGTMLLHKLRAIYAAVEDTETKELEKRQVNLAEVIPPENFYAGPSRRPQRQAALRAANNGLDDGIEVDVETKPQQGRGRGRGGRVRGRRGGQRGKG
ncbi:hypothetical protein EYR38_009508 [Pleurotus pulmonarius]|nr:hypothetical protein EYR38_009508 [Pleurotus pulmonarius]